MRSNPILAARDLTKHFGSGDTVVRAVDGVSLELGAGELVLIMGPSGSGKTTLLSMLGGLLRPTAGTIVLDGAEISALPEGDLPRIRALKIGFVFQAFNLLDALTVEENVLLPAALAPGGIRAARARGEALLLRLGLTARSKAYPKTLSGGEKQRVAIARALINQPPLVLADEPTGNIDSQKGQEVMMILHDIARDDGCSVLLVTHDPRVEEVADRILWLEDGQLRDRKAESHKWVRDPVCGMRVDEWTSAHFIDHEGQRLHFCSTRCSERFADDPDRWLKGADAGSRPREST
jgi:putative ABC transport system ATP-binding protein